MFVRERNSLTTEFRRVRHGVAQSKQCEKNVRI